MKIRLTRKFADFLDGVDLRHHRVGEAVELPRHEAELLLAEGWAAPAEDESHVHATADDRPRPSRKTSTE